MTTRWPRRAFLKVALAGAALSVPVVMGVGKLGGLFTSGKDLDLGSATAATFRPYMGQQFDVSNPRVTLQLDDVRTYGPLVFSLTFRGPATGALSQSTYSFKHEQLGNFPLFIVPHGDQTYEAVFNHQTAA